MAIEDNTRVYLYFCFFIFIDSNAWSPSLFTLLALSQIHNALFESSIPSMWKIQLTFEFCHWEGKFKSLSLKCWRCMLYNKYIHTLYHYIPPPIYSTSYVSYTDYIRVAGEQLGTEIFSYNCHLGQSHLTFTFWGAISISLLYAYSIAATFAPRVALSQALLTRGFNSIVAFHGESYCLKSIWINFFAIDVQFCWAHKSISRSRSWHASNNTTFTSLLCRFVYSETFQSTYLPCCFPP